MIQVVTFPKHHTLIGISYFPPLGNGQSGFRDMKSCGSSPCQSRKALLKIFILVKHDLVQDRDVTLIMENVGYHLCQCECIQSAVDKCQDKTLSVYCPCFVLNLERSVSLYRPTSAAHFQFGHFVPDDRCSSLVDYMSFSFKQNNISWSWGKLRSCIVFFFYQ